MEESNWTNYTDLKSRSLALATVVLVLVPFEASFKFSTCANQMIVFGELKESETQTWVMGAALILGVVVAVGVRFVPCSGASEKANKCALFGTLGASLR
jgi:hypothetical protein